MPTTALSHFQQDAARARAIVTHANPLPVGTAGERLLRSDLLRSAWMFAVGALDAYFCDAYTDIVAATIIAKSQHTALALPDFFYEIRFPVRQPLQARWGIEGPRGVGPVGPVVPVRRHRGRRWRR